MFKSTLSGFEGIVTLVVSVGFGLTILFVVIVPFVTQLIVGLAPLLRLAAS